MLNKALVSSCSSTKCTSSWPEKVTATVECKHTSPSPSITSPNGFLITFLLSSRDAANLLKPMLARGKLRCIGATTLSEYRKYIEKDAAFERRFAQVMVNEPSVADTISILRGISEKYEVHHGVRILDASLFQAATLAHRYLVSINNDIVHGGVWDVADKCWCNFLQTSKRLPDSAIDLVDEACANVRVARETSPEAIDTLERQKLQLQVEIHALSVRLSSSNSDTVLGTDKIPVLARER